MKLTEYQHNLLRQLGSSIFSIQQEKKKMIKIIKELDDMGLTFQEGSQYAAAKKIINQQ